MILVQRNELRFRLPNFLGRMIPEGNLDLEALRSQVGDDRLEILITGRQVEVRPSPY